MCWDWRHLYSLSYSDSVESQRSSGEHQAVGLWHVTPPTPSPPSPPTPQQQQPRWSWRWRCWSAWSLCARVSNTWKVKQDSPQYKDHQLQVWEGPLVVRPHYSSSSHWTPHTSHLTPVQYQRSGVQVWRVDVSWQPCVTWTQQQQSCWLLFVLLWLLSPDLGVAHWTVPVWPQYMWGSSPCLALF